MNKIFKILLIILTVSTGSAETVSISIQNIDLENSTIDIYMINSEPVGGFQFDLTGVTIDSVITGTAIDNGFMVSVGGNTVLGFSLTGSTISQGQGILTTLSVSDIQSLVCLEGIVFSDAAGSPLSISIGDCWTPIPDIDGVHIFFGDYFEEFGPTFPNPIPIYFESAEYISIYQFTLQGISGIIEATGGVSEDNEFQFTFNNNTVTGNVNPLNVHPILPGSGILTELTFSGSSYINCITNAVVTNSDDELVNVEVGGCWNIENCPDCNLTYGCPDETSCTYNTNADIVGEEYCEYPEEFYDCASNCLNDEDGDDVCDELEVDGCTDQLACNYNETATDDDGSCEYPDEFLNCNGDCMSDIDNDGICDELELPGCTGIEACNYDEDATDDDGSCDNAPGILEDLSVAVELNTATITWSEPCGAGYVWLYFLHDEDTDDGIMIITPFNLVLMDLNWSTQYNMFIRTHNNNGISYTPFSFEIGPEPIPEQIENIDFVSGEAEISMSWASIDYAEFYNIYLNNELFILTNFTEYVHSQLNANTEYSYAISSVNSQGVEGDLSTSTSIYPLPIPIVENISALPGPGSVHFTWDSPIPYGGLIDYMYEIYNENNELLESDVESTSYLVENLVNYNIDVCIKIKSVHLYGNSLMTEENCSQPEIPLPGFVEGFFGIPGEASIILYWTPQIYPFHLVNIYRDGILILENYFGVPNYTDSDLLAGIEYQYQIAIVNDNLLIGPISDPIFLTTLPIAEINDLQLTPDNARVYLDWSAPPDYAEFGFIYEVLDDTAGVIKTSDDTHTHISGLSSEQEYCFQVRAVSMGGLGYAPPSNITCGSPNEPFGEYLEWGIQVIVDLNDFYGVNVDSDKYNLIGVHSNATNEYDPDYDFMEPYLGFGNEISLFFPHPEWGIWFGNNPVEKFTQDIRQISDLSNAVIEWESRIEALAWGYPSLTFYMINDFTDRTIYLDYADSLFIKIDDGDIVELDFMYPGDELNFSIVVGNAVPEAPINLVAIPDYHAASIQWQDPCCEEGIRQYPAETFNLYRSGILIDSLIMDTFYTEIGLEHSTTYSYTVTGVNAAGEGPPSQTSVEVTTLLNRSPIADAGIDLLLYDLSNDENEEILITIPINVNFNIENRSYDPDNFYIDGNGDMIEYGIPIDALEYSWTSLGIELSDEPEFEILLSYGENAYVLKVEDESEFSATDSVYITVVDLPPPAELDSLLFSPSLYSIYLQWNESNYTGESYADLNRNGVWDDHEPYIDCGYDGLCPGDIGYISPDEGQSNGIWEFNDENGNEILDWIDSNSNGEWDDGEGEQFETWSDINNNLIWDDYEPFIDSPDGDGVVDGQYQSGSHPRPPYYGLPFNNGPDNLAEKYKIYFNGDYFMDVSEPDVPQFGEVNTTFSFSFEGLDPSTEYCFAIETCNIQEECIMMSPEQCVSTTDRPSVNIISPNGAELIGYNDIDIELEFTNIGNIKFVELQLQIDDVTPILDLYSTDNISENYNDLIISGIEGVHQDAKIISRIIDIGDVTSDEVPTYIDLSDNSFILVENEMTNQFVMGWHIFGTPLELDEYYINESNFQSGGVAPGSWAAFDYAGGYSNLILESGQGFYIYFTQPTELTLTGNINSVYQIELVQGWNLISNPLVMSMNIGNLDILYNDVYLPWANAADLGLISPLLIGFDNSITSHVPSNEFEPFEGYWIHTQDEMALRVMSKIEPTNPVIDGSELNDWRLSLYSRAFNANNGSFGDVIEMGFSLNATHGYDSGIDEYHLPFNSLLSPYTLMKINHDDWVEEGLNNGFTLESSNFYRDIRENYDTLYVWEIHGDVLNIGTQDNMDEEVVLTWEMGDLDSEYDITLHIGNDSIDMRFENYLKINSVEFQEMFVKVELHNYVTGCGAVDACNYYCEITPWECPENELPPNFADDGSCDFETCIGCIDPLASNFNPNALIDSGDCEYLESILLPNEVVNLFPEAQIVNQIPVELKNYNDEDIFGIEIKFSMDPTILQVTNFDFTNGIFDNDLYSDEDNNLNENYTMIWDYNESFDTLGVVIYASGTPINGSGIIFNLIVDVMGQPDDESTIGIIHATLNYSEMFSNSATVIIENGSFAVGGNINYYSDINYPVDEVLLSIFGYSEIPNEDTLTALSYTYSTIEDGEFLFNEVLKGSYLTTAFKDEPDNSDRGLSAQDASRIARFSVDLFTLTENEQFAGDVDLNGDVNSVDASRVARYLVGIIDQLNSIDLDWRFKPEDEFFFNLYDIPDQSFIENDYKPLETDYLSENILGLRLGDVDGDWSTDVLLRTNTELEYTDMIMKDESSEFILPIIIEDEITIEGIDISIHFDGDVISFDSEIGIDNSLFDNYSLLTYQPESGIMNLVIFANSELETFDNLQLRFKFEKMNASMENTQISIEKLLINSIDISEAGIPYVIDGKSKMLRNVNIIFEPIPTEFSLGSNFPNPFNPITTIPFALPEESNVKLTVFDILGRKVEILHTGVMTSGFHQIQWDASDYSSGVYFIELISSANMQSGNSELFTQTQKLLLLK